MSCGEAAANLNRQDQHWPSIVNAVVLQTCYTRQEQPTLAARFYRGVRIADSPRSCTTLALSCQQRGLGTSEQTVGSPFVVPRSSAQGSVHHAVRLGPRGRQRALGRTCGLVRSTVSTRITNLAVSCHAFTSWLCTITQNAEPLNQVNWQ